MFQGFILQLVKGFVLRQMQKYLGSIDWDKVKADADKRVRDLMPGEWFDDEVAAICAKAIDLARSAASCKSCIEGLADAAQLLASGDSAGAKSVASKVAEAIWADVVAQLKA